MTATFSYENLLPVLPVPDLNSTFEQLEECIKPLNVAEGYHRHPLRAEKGYILYQAISRFLKSDVAQKLQGKLQELTQHEPQFLDDLQLDIYNHALTREIEGDVLPRNPFLVLSEDAVEGISQQDRASVLCLSALKFISALRHDLLPPDKGSLGEPLSMLPYLDLFGTTRCPVLTADDIQILDESLPFEQSDNLSLDSIGITKQSFQASKHIVVISRGQHYSLDVLDANNCPLHDGETLAQIMDYILTDSQKTENIRKATSLGSFTSYSLRRWRHARRILQKKGPEQLKTVDSALFILVLDESSPTFDEAHECNRLFHGSSVIDKKTGRQTGSCCSRWYDKLQLVITRDAKAGVIWDSFTCDGSAVLRFASDIYADSVLRLAREINESPVFSLWPTKTVHASKPRVDKIAWSLCSALQSSVNIAETSLTDLICRHDVVHKHIPYGRRMAHRLGINADSMIQVALQIAHYELYGRMTFTFEPVSTRCFRSSRSAFVPVQNQQLFELCQLFSSNVLDTRSKLEKFTLACLKHRSNVNLSKRGKGFEKHFNTLKFLYQKYKHFQIDLNPLDLQVASAVFDDDLLVPISNPEIVAAHCGNSATTAFGINPAVPQGFGIGYSLESDRCDLTVTSQFRQGKRFLLVLKSVLDEISYCTSCNTKELDANGMEGDIPSIACLNGVHETISLDNELFSLKGSYLEASGKKDLWGTLDNLAAAESKTPSQPASDDSLTLKTTSRSRHRSSVTMEPASAFMSDEERQCIGTEIFVGDPCHWRKQ
ncbi:LANO_0H24564g1_1 [Lachancea nothofagi CBS 11611]|uniref:LANO_0H24564g1_1 n=1 Tax=Lachancea nothofagi CBS 11611 TaxID=1266666 RepID=A0A1G4KP13_9SACH|nr:LANO_0H24564g1_1 [Lachancea nothofagi CBS 11611]